LSLTTFAVATVDSKRVLTLAEHDAAPANGTGGNAAGQPEAQHCATRQEK
jgi:3-phenylpropionate/trans-cinnamate dioxygenase ferredoxin subunit